MLRTLAFASLAWALTACSISHRSQDFACTTSADCTDGRTCIDGFCVTGSGPGVDAPAGSGGHNDAGIDAPKPLDAHVPPADAAVCPTICSSCDFGSMTCDIDCAVPTGGDSRCGSGTSGTGGNQATVQCPPGFNCTIECTTPGSCRSVSCIGGLSCQVQCASAQSCKTVACGKGACDVECTGQSSCKNVACGESCKCDVDCQGQETCTGSIICSNEACDNFLTPGCDSTNDSSCDVCQ
jgi:hypothetical protein